MSGPVLLYFTIKRYTSAILLSIVIWFIDQYFIMTLTVKLGKINVPSRWFINSYIIRLWIKYFDVDIEISPTINFETKVPYFFFEYPHGIIPIGQFLSGMYIFLFVTVN